MGLWFYLALAWIIRKSGEKCSLIYYTMLCRSEGANCYMFYVMYCISDSNSLYPFYRLMEFIGVEICIRIVFETMIRNCINYFIYDIMELFCIPMKFLPVTIISCFTYLVI